MNSRIRSAILAALVAACCQAQDARNLLNQGVTAYRNGNYQQAAGFFKRATVAGPQSVNAWIYLGTAIAASHDIFYSADARQRRDAEAAFLKALELSPDNKVALASLAVVYRLWGPAKAAEAQHRLQRLVELDPKNLLALDSLGGIKLDAALDIIFAARSRAGIPIDSDSPIPDAKLRQAANAAASPPLNDAIDYFSRALDIGPTEVSLTRRLAACWRYKADLSADQSTAAEALKTAGRFDYQSDVIQKGINDGTKKVPAGSSWDLEIESSLLIYPPLPPPPPLPDLPAR